MAEGPCPDSLIMRRFVHSRTLNEIFLLVVVGLLFTAFTDASPKAPFTKRDGGLEKTPLGGSLICRASAKGRRILGPYVL